MYLELLFQGNHQLPFVLQPGGSSTYSFVVISCQCSLYCSFMSILQSILDQVGQRMVRQKTFTRFESTNSCIQSFSADSLILMSQDFAVVYYAYLFRRCSLIIHSKIVFHSHVMRTSAFVFFNILHPAQPQTWSKQSIDKDKHINEEFSYLRNRSLLF